MVGNTNGSPQGKLEEARQHYIQSLAETMELYGLSPSMGLLYGIMFFRDGTITLDEMCEESGMSKTSMSVGVRELSRLKLVHKKWQKGVRKDLYEVERNHFRAFNEFFAYMWTREIELNEQGVVSSERALKQLLRSPDLSAQEREQVERDLAKLENSKLYYDWLRELTRRLQDGTLLPIPDSTEET